MALGQAKYGWVGYCWKDHYDGNGQPPTRCLSNLGIFRLSWFFRNSLGHFGHLGQFWQLWFHHKVPLWAFIDGLQWCQIKARAEWVVQSTDRIMYQQRSGSRISWRGTWLVGRGMGGIWRGGGCLWNLNSVPLAAPSPHGNPKLHWRAKCAMCNRAILHWTLQIILDGALSILKGIV